MMYNQIAAVLTTFFSVISSRKKNAVRFILMSGAMAFIIVGLLSYVGYVTSGALGSYLSGLIPWEWAHESTLFSFISGLFLLVIMIILIKYILLLLMSPLLSHISEQTALDINGILPKAKNNVSFALVRGLRINLRNLFKELFITLILFFIGFIPGINIFAVPFLFIVQFYFTGFGFMDFYLERDYSFSETISEVYSHKWAAITIGALFFLLFLIPVAGIFIGPYLATVTATRYFVNVKRHH